MPKISIIVPVYQVEKYLEKCVNSILEQTFTDFELILVDDGSTDHGPAMCDQYAEQDVRIKVIHKKNGGLSDARNAGIEIAQGDYLGFVDSDDYIAADMYELLYRDITKENADLAICGIYHVYEGKQPKEKENFYLVVDANRALEIIFHGNVISDHAVNKLYKRKIFNDLRYSVGNYHEDSIIIVDILDKCQKVVIDSKQKYYYYHRDDSITSQSFSRKHLAYITAWENNEIKVQNRTKDLDIAAHQRVCFANFLVLDKIVKSNMENEVPETRDIIRYLRHNYKFILKNPIFTKGRKAALTGLMFNIKCYKFFVEFQYKFIVRSNK